MKANFTSKLNTIAKAFVFTAALMFLGHQGHAQAPLRGGSTYYVNGIGVDLVAPKDTFKDLSGTYSGTPYVTPYTTTTGIMNALTLNGTDSTTVGTVNIILAPGYVGYVEPNLINVGDPNNGGYPYQGSNRPIVLSPAAGYNDTITSSTVINGTSFNSLWKFNGIQFFTIDGQSTTGQRNLTFKMTASSNSTNAQIINIVSPSAVGSGTQYITIKNCNFIGNSNSTAINTWSAIYMGTVYFGVVMPWNNFKTSQNITIQNNDIRAVQNGIYMRGKGDVAGSQDRFLNINNNIIGGTIAPGGTANTDFVGGSSTSSGSSGIYLSAQANATIQNNIIRNSVNNTVGFTAILLDNASGTAALDSNLYINANTIYNITTNVVGYASNGIRVAMGTHTQPLAIVISNNIMGNISGPGYLTLNSTNISSAIMIQDASANAGVSILHNSMNMYGSVLSGTYGTTMYSACVWLGGSLTGGVSMQNNILANRQGRMSTNYAGATTYGVISLATSGSPFSACDGNDYYINTTDGGNAFVGYSGVAGGTQLVSINHWRTFTGSDNNSLTAIPPFSSDTLLQLSSSTPSLLSNAGVSGTGVGSDIIGNSRPYSGPSCGAYQFTSSGGSVNIALVGGNTYLINGTKAWPTAASANSGSFTNLTEAITYVNAYGVSGAGNVVLELQSTYPGEGTNYLPAFIDYPNQSGNRPVYIKPHIGTTATITIPNQLNFSYNAVLRFIGARYVTFDGTNQNMTILMPSNATNNTARVIAITPASMSATTDITINNCIITGNSTNSSSGVINTFAGIFAGGLFGNTSELCGLNNNHTFSNNLIQGVQTGIYMRGYPAKGLQDQNIAITYNTIGGTIPAGVSAPTTYIGGAASKAGIHLKGVLGTTVDGNIVRNCLNGYNDFRGIDLATDGEAGADSLLFIQNNKIYNLQTTSNGNFGIKINLGADSLRQISITNNFIGKITGTGFFGVSLNAANPSGISISTTSSTTLVGHIGISMYYNTIQMSGSVITWSNNGTNCLWLGAGVTGGVIAQNNIFANNLSGTTGVPVNVYAIQLEGVNKPFSGGGKIDNNVYSLGGINGTTKYIGSNASASFPTLGSFTTANTWRNYSSQDTFSYMYTTSFVSDTMPDVLTQAAGPIVNGAAQLSFINRDIYSTARAGAPGYSLVPAGTAPCIGAVEFAQPYAKLVGGATYYINGTQNPPLYTAPGNGSFATVNRAFQYVNGYGVNGSTAPANPITLLITSGYIGEGDTLITTLQDYPNMNANRFIVLKSDSIRTITTAGGANGPYSANGSLIRFSGASYFMIDGTVNGTPRGLTFALPATASSISTAKVIDFVPGSVSSSNVKIQNCNILGSSTTSGNNTFAGIYSGGLTTPSNASLTGSNNNRFTNNFIGGVNYGVYLQGAPVKDIGDTINLNLIGGNIAPGGSTPTNYFGGITSAAGIFLSSQANVFVDSNVIKNNIRTFSLNSGIRLSNITSTFNSDSNITITRNNIYNIISTTGAAAYGIYMNLGTDSMRKITIAQNWISGISATGTTQIPVSQVNPVGILVDGLGTINNYGLTVAFNSINFGTTSTGTTTSYAGSACIQFAPAINGGVSLINNVLQNRLSNSQTTSSNYSVLVGANKNIFTTINTNNYYSGTLNGTSGLMAYNVGSTPVVLSTIPQVQAYTGSDTTSINFPINNFISDTVLDLPTASASVLAQRVKYNNSYTLDILKRFRGNPSTIGASEWTAGTPIDSVAPRVYKMVLASSSACASGSFSIPIRVYSSQSITSDTLYYKVNGGAQQIVTSGSWTGGISTTGSFFKTYTIPAQPSNSVILFRVSVNDANGLKGTNGTYPATAGTWDTIATNISVFPYAYGFDGPNVNRWASQQISGSGGWILGTYGSTSNPNYSTAYSGVKMAMFPANTLANGTASRLVSPCFDFTTTTLPTLRLWVTQNADIPQSPDSLVFSVSVSGGPFVALAGVCRVNPNYIFPGWKQIDICLGDYVWSNQVKIGIEGYAKHPNAGYQSNNIMIDSVMIIDNYISSPVTSAKVRTICHYDSLSVTVSNSIPGVSYQLFDILSGQFFGNPYFGNGGSINVKAANPLLDSVWLLVQAINTIAPNPGSCLNYMHDTSIVYIKLFKNGPFAIKGIPYSGSFYAGTNLNPDAAKVGDTLTYTILPPSGLTNADYGTKWTVATPSIKTIVGISASNITFTPPTSTANGSYVMKVGTPDADSIFYMNLDFRLLPSGCDSFLVRKIKITSVPLTAFTNDGRDTACRHAVVHFVSTNIPNSLTAPYTYLWDFGDSTYSTNSSVNKVYNTPGTYIVKLTEFNNAGLPGTVAKTFVVLPSPAAAFTNSKPCSGDTVVFTNNTVGGTTNVWTYGSVFTPVSTGSSTAANPHFYLQAPGGDTGTFIVTLYAYNSFGCSDTTVHTVQLFAKPHAQFTITNHCLGALATITNTSYITGATNSFGSVWNPGTGDSTFLSNTPNYRFTKNGTFTTRLTVTSNYGCVDSTNHIVTIYDKPRTSFTYDTSTTCVGTNVNFTNGTTYSGGNNKILYSWNFGDQSVNSTSFIPSHSYGSLGNATIVLLATDTVHFCQDSTVKTVQINETPVPQFQAATKGCRNTAIPFTNKSSFSNGLVVKYLWSFGDGATDTATNTSHTYTTAGNDTVSLTATATSGCTSKVSGNLSISPAPTASFAYDSLTYFAVRMRVTPSTFASYKYILDDGTGPYTAYRDTLPSHTYNTGGWHKVITVVTDNNGCTGTRTDSVHTNRGVGIATANASQFGINVYPNPFTDATNVSYNLANTSNVHIRVYDMLGRLVADIDNGTQSAGQHSTIINAENFQASTSAYMVRIQIGDVVVTRQIIREK
jgi:hypothetical protein